MDSEMKGRIIHSTAELIFKHGYSGVRVDDIANFAGISKKTIYNHFPNKSSLINAVIESNTEDICKKIDVFGLDDRRNLNWLKKIFLLIVYCCQELSGWILPAVEYRPKTLTEKLEKSFEQITGKLKERAEKFLDEDIGRAKAVGDLSCRALLSLSLAVVDGLFHLSGLCLADKIEQNPLIRNLKAMADAYEMKTAVFREDPEAGPMLKIAGPGYPPEPHLLETGDPLNKLPTATCLEKSNLQENQAVKKLEQRIKELENESAELRQVEDDLRRSKDRFSLALETSEAMPWEINIKTCEWHCDPEDYETYGYETKEEFEEMIQMVESTLRYLKNTDDLSRAIEDLEIPTHPEDYGRLYAGGKAVLDGEKNAYEGDFRMMDKNGKWAWYYGKAKVTGWDEEGNAEILSGITIDITERKKVEETLREREARLASQAHTLEETNTALKVLLKNREEDKKEFEEKIISNLKEMVFPFIEKLTSSRLDENQMVYLDIIKSHLNDITAPFLHHLSSKYSGLTPAEIKVAVFVKEGKTTKEIAELMNSSTDAVNFHRNNLRKKFGLVNSKTNLRTHLLSLS